MLAIILSEWIGATALVRLDTAVSSHALREHFLPILKSESFVCNHVRVSECAKYSENFRTMSEWLARRQIKVRDWTLSGKISPSQGVELVRATGGPHVCSVLLQGPLDSDMQIALFSAISINCPNISKIALTECYWAPLLVLSGPILSSVKELTILSCRERDEYDIIEFDQFCLPNLWKLHLFNAQGEQFMKPFAHLLQHAPHLSHLRLEDV